MMRTLLPILFIAALLTQLLGKSIITAHYLLNKEKITKELCVNKAKPTKKCHGKCQLMKKLKEQKQKEEGNSPVSLPEVLKGKTEWPAELNEFAVTVPVSEITIALYSVYFVAETSVQQSDIFHPPCC
ncbi:MAG: hypothetical protein ACK5Z2_12545 [Bacteroidota bacterium]|jgi:hypothetical protein